MKNLARGKKVIFIILLAFVSVAYAQDKATPTCAELPPLHITVTSSNGDKLFDGTLPGPIKELALSFPSVKIRICSEINPGGAK